MFKRTVGAIAAVLTAILFFDLTAQAQDAWEENSRTRVSAFTSGSFTSSERTFNKDPLDPASDLLNTKLVSGGKVGARVTYDYTPKMAFEGTFSYGTNNLLVSDFSQTPIESRGFGVRLSQYSGNVLYFLTLPGSKMRPFVTAGIGLTNFSPTDSAKAKAVDPNGEGFIDEKAVINSSSKLGLNFGGGIETKITQKFGLRFDFRDFWTGIPTFGLPQTDPGGAVDFYPVSGSIHNLSTSIGFVFFLD